MIMIAVWYDPDCDQVWISDAERSYACRSLVSFIDANTGKVGVRLKTANAADIVMAEYWKLTDRAGLGFLSAIEAKAYLDGEFAKRRAVGFEFQQEQPASVWTIVHALGYRPAVSLVDTAGDPMTADWRYPDVDTVTITFNVPASGTAYLS